MLKLVIRFVKRSANKVQKNLNSYLLKKLVFQDVSASYKENWLQVHEGLVLYKEVEYWNVAQFDDIL